jgi:hypothetical protein
MRTAGSARWWVKHNACRAYRSATLCAAAALLLLASCTKNSAPPNTPFNHEEFARSVIVSMIVESDPEDSPADLRNQIKRTIPTLAQQYNACTPDQKALVRGLVQRFVDCEDSQFADVSRWYTQLNQAVASGSGGSITPILQRDILGENTKGLVASLPPRLREVAETQMRGVDAGPKALLSDMEKSGPLQSSNVLAGLEAAARYDGMRTQSYGKTYNSITGEDLRRPQDSAEADATITQDIAQNLPPTWLPVSPSLITAYNEDMRNKTPGTRARYVAGFTRGKPADGTDTGTEFIWVQKTPMPDPPGSPNDFANALLGGGAEIAAQHKDAPGERLSSLDPTRPHYDPDLHAVVCDLSANFRDGTAGRARSFLIITKRFVLSINAYSAPTSSDTVFSEARKMVSNLKRQAELELPAPWTERLKGLLN